MVLDLGRASFSVRAAAVDVEPQPPHPHPHPALHHCLIITHTPLSVQLPELLNLCEEPVGEETELQSPVLPAGHRVGRDFMSPIASNWGPVTNRNSSELAVAHTTFLAHADFRAWLEIFLPKGGWYVWFRISS